MFYIDKKIVLSCLIALVSGMVASASEDPFASLDLKEGSQFQMGEDQLTFGENIQKNVYKGQYKKSPVIIKRINKDELQNSLQACSLEIGPKIHFFIESEPVKDSYNTEHTIKVEDYLKDVPITADNVKDIFSTLSRQLLTLNQAGINHDDISPSNVIGSTFIDFAKLIGGTPFFSNNNKLTSQVIALCRVVIWKLYKKDFQGWGIQSYNNIIEFTNALEHNIKCKKEKAQDLFVECLKYLSFPEWEYAKKCICKEKFNSLAPLSFSEIRFFLKFKKCIQSQKMESLMGKIKIEKENSEFLTPLTPELEEEIDSFCCEITKSFNLHFWEFYEEKIRSFPQIAVDNININEILLDGALGRIKDSMELRRLLNLDSRDEPITYNGSVYPCYYTNGKEAVDLSISEEGEIIVTTRKSKDVLDGSNHINTPNSIKSPTVHTDREISGNDTSDGGYNLKVSIGISCAVICLIVVGLKVFRKPKPKGRLKARKSRKTGTSNRHPRQSNSRLGSVAEA